jgi:pSer/pThr/pTyr-binding forkhead associated (FHA) protein
MNINDNANNKTPEEDPYRRPNRTESFVKATPKDDTEIVVGFLYSISHNGTAEYWTLHLGSNTIGKAPENDIRLMEASVSASHATINIKQMKTTGSIIAFIRDIGSKSGIYLNDTELDYEGHSCKNGDLITIGDAYKLLLILVDINGSGLSTADNFKEIEINTISNKPTDIIDLPVPNSNAYERKGARNNIETIDTSEIDLIDPGETRFM